MKQQGPSALFNLEVFARSVLNGISWDYPATIIVRSCIVMRNVLKQSNALSEVQWFLHWFWGAQEWQAWPADQLEQTQTQSYSQINNIWNDCSPLTAASNYDSVLRNWGYIKCFPTDDLV